MPVGVELITWTCDTVSPFTVAGPCSTWFGAAPLIDQPASLCAPSSDQATPAPPGRLSVTAMPVAGSVPRLNRDTLNPICAPGETCGASAELSIVRAGVAGALQLGNVKFPMRVRQLAALFGAL